MRNKTLIVIIITFILTALAWNVLIPPYENLDEIEHSEVIRYITATGKLPAHGTAEEAGYHVRQEASQPPLYHILGAGWARLWQLPTNAMPRQGGIGVIECGPSDTFYNKANWARTPYQEGPPWSAALYSLHALRLFSTLLQIATLVGTWTLARRVFPQGPVPLLSTALVAFNPQFLLIVSGVNNDNVITPLATWGIVWAYDLWKEGATPWRLLRYSLLCGLAMLSKLSGFGLIGLGGLALLIRVLQEMPLRERRLQDWTDAFRRLALWSLLIIVPAMLIVTPWLLRNQRLYGDPTALAPMLEKVGHRDTPIAWGEARLMLLSYWGQMPCSFYPRALYWPYLLIMLGGLLGVGLGWRHYTPKQRLALSLAATWFVVIVLAWVRWNSTTPAPGGRLLFPAIAALALILAAGWNALLKAHPRRQLLIGAFLPIWALITLRSGPLLLFAPPPLREETHSLPNPSQTTFGEHIHLRGYTAKIVRPQIACVLANASYCQNALDVTLYWQASATIGADWTMALQLASPVPGDTTLYWNYNHWPGQGNLPTSAWPSGPIIQDRYLLPLPDDKAATQAWTLQLVLFDMEDATRLNVFEGEQAIGNAKPLTTLRIPGTATESRPSSPGQPLATFGNVIALKDAQVHAENGEWEIDLLWESVASPSKDYTVFVHAYAADGTLIATGDAPPQGGHFPTRLWADGDLITDKQQLHIPTDSAPARIAIGLYDPLSGERLAATVAGTPLPDAAANIWEAAP